MRFLISGGGTGGHVYPALAVVAEIRRQGTGPADGVYVGRAGGIEERLARRAQIPFEAIEVGAVRGLMPWTAVRNLSRLVKTVSRVRALIRTLKPNVIFVTGGYVSAPVIWAGAAEHVPSVIYLPDLEPGWAVRATARWATRVAVSFPEVAQHFTKGKAVVTGYPVRPEFFSTDRRRAREILELEPGRRTVTIFGGSRGAHRINEAAMANLNPLAGLAQVVHITGSEDQAAVTASVQALGPDLCRRVRVFGYLDDLLPHALAAADVVVARAGAATLGELPALGLPGILVPYPFAGKHQERNSQFLVQRGAALQVDDAALTRELVPTLQALFEAPERLQRMGEAARALARPQAAADIAALLRSLGEARQ